MLDQYEEHTLRDTTIRECFNTYRFADHKEKVIDLLQRGCTVSVETVRIVSQLNLLASVEPEDGTYLTEAHPPDTPDNHGVDHDQRQSQNTTRAPGPRGSSKAEAVFAKMGTTQEQAIAVFYKQTALTAPSP